MSPSSIAWSFAGGKQTPYKNRCDMNIARLPENRQLGEVVEEEP